MTLANVLLTGASTHASSHLVNKLSKHPRQCNTYAISLAKSEEPTLHDLFEKTTFEALFLVLPQTRDAVARTKSLLDVAQQNQIKFVVMLSEMGCSEIQNDPLAQSYCEIERYLKGSRIPHTILRVAPLQENFLWFSDDFHRTIPTLSLPFSTGAHAPISAADVANVAAAILSNPRRHASRTYTLTGPDALTGVEICGRASQGLRRPVRFRNASGEEVRRKLIEEAKVSPAEAGLFAAISERIACRHFEVTTATVQDITHRPARSIDEFFAQNRTLFNKYTDEEGRRNDEIEEQHHLPSFDARYKGFDGNGLGRFAFSSKL
ncbi:hypothetical protein HKX48_009449 [Thoreauomyces humboldtii]|nr:hypothetical protein HKX48_009449 [Thoreauomyces humboldtii]